MMILFRKADGFLKHTSLYEWQPVPSSNGKWYRVRRENISAVPLRCVPADLEQQGYVRQLFNAALAGVTCRVHAKYRRETKTLTLEVMKG